MKNLDADSLDAFFEQLLETDLFLPLSVHQARSVYANFKIYTSQFSVQHFMFGMPGVVYLFDSAFWGIRSIEASYLKLFLEMSGMTRGCFDPTAVSFTCNPSPQAEHAIVDLAFQFNGRFFQYTLTQMGDMVDLNLVQSINQTIGGCGINGRFYRVETHDQINAISFLTNAQYEIIKPRYNQYISLFEDHL